MAVTAQEMMLNRPSLGARLSRLAQARWQRIVVFVPYVWMPGVDAGLLPVPVLHRREDQPRG